MAAVLEIEGLTRRFGTLVALDRLTLSVEEGEIFGLLGRNGAGKTTLVRILTTLLQPSAGTASVAGYDVVRQAAIVRRIIGYVPQALSADGELTGYENLEVFARLYDLPRLEREERVRTVLAFMGLSEVAGQLVRTYSGGMIRRLEIGQSMLHRPRILFLDEPTVGLDPVAREAVWQHIQELREHYGTTICLTTHYMEEAEQLCDRVAILRQGRLMALGTLGQLKAAVGNGAASLNDVFIHYSGDELEGEGEYRATAAARRNLRKLR